jgi:hypothetical protein
VRRIIRGERLSSARSACAVLLMLLIALPFTAPFSTCDVATLLASSRHGVTTPHHRQPSRLVVTIDNHDTSPTITMDDDDHMCELVPPAAAIAPDVLVAAPDAMSATQAVPPIVLLPLRL